LTSVRPQSQCNDRAQGRQNAGNVESSFGRRHRIRVVVSSGEIFAKAGTAKPTKASGTSVSASGSGASGGQDKRHGCIQGTPHCATTPPPRNPIGGGANPNKGGPDNPVLHPK
jgi:hypothetical protein